MKNSKIIKDVLVFNFASGEKTKELSEYCFRKLNYENIITINDKTGFTDKFKKCAEIAVNSKYEVFIRTDADRLVFDGIDTLVENFKNDKVDCAEGLGHEYFMNCFRGATPHVFSRRVFELLYENNDLMPDVQKPENFFIANLVNSGLIKEKTYKILTNLHEYEQLPSKVCNSIQNRIARGHLGYYNFDYLNSLKKYSEAIKYAISNYSEKKSMDHYDYSFLDKGFLEKDSNKSLESLYLKHERIYRELLKKYDEQEVTR